MFFIYVDIVYPYILYDDYNNITQFEQALQLLIINPFDSSLDIKSLKWYEWFYRLRLGKYRFIYEIIDYKLIIDFINADSRGDIYKWL